MVTRSNLLFSVPTISLCPLFFFYLNFRFLRLCASVSSGCAAEAADLYLVTWHPIDEQSFFLWTNQPQERGTAYVCTNTTIHGPRDDSSFITRHTHTHHLHRKWTGINQNARFAGSWYENLVLFSSPQHQPKSWLSIISRLLRKKMEDNQCNDQRVSSTLPLFNNEGRKMGFLILLHVKERWLKRGAKAAGMEKRS